jgi:hypothetical protein
VLLLLLLLPPSQVELIMEKMPNLLTSKPVIYLVNMSATDYIRKKNKWLPKIHGWIQEHGGGVMIPFSVEFESKLWDVRENQLAKQVTIMTGVPQMHLSGGARGGGGGWGQEWCRRVGQVGESTCLGGHLEMARKQLHACTASGV